MGNSFGGALALSMAIRHPDRVNKLVLMGVMSVPFPITYGLDAVNRKAIPPLPSFLEIVT